MDRIGPPPLSTQSTCLLKTSVYPCGPVWAWWGHGGGKVLATLWPPWGTTPSPPHPMQPAHNTSQCFATRVWHCLQPQPPNGCLQPPLSPTFGVGQATHSVYQKRTVYLSIRHGILVDIGRAYCLSTCCLIAVYSSV